VPCPKVAPPEVQPEDFEEVSELMLPLLPPQALMSVARNIVIKKN
jgi:hypothetical protein